MSTFDEIIDISNLKKAFKQSYKVERTAYSSEFALLLPFRLTELQTRLENGTWLPHKYKEFKVYEPKERLVAKAHFEDRIVHHAYHNVMEEITEKVFSPYSAATRKGKGVLYALEMASNFINQYEYFLKFDIRHYFESINHDKLLEVLEKYTDDERVHSLERVIVANAVNKSGEKVGLPIGNLTSQFWANVYLNELDEFLINLGFKFVRYMDDTIVFAQDRKTLVVLLKGIKDFLSSVLFLTLKNQVTLLSNVNNAFPFLGRVLKRGDKMHLRKENRRRILKKLNKKAYLFEEGLISYNHYFQSLSSYLSLL